MHESMDNTQQEIVKLSEAVLLYQRELAQVREQQEPLEERYSLWKHERDKAVALSDQLAQALATHLSGTFWEEQQPGVRIGWGHFAGSRWPWLKRLLGRRQTAAVVEEQKQVRRIETSPLFDSAWYLQENLDVAQAGIHPAVHYLHAGAQEGRNPGPKFDTNAYLAEHPELAGAGVNPLLHQLQSRGG